MKRSNYKWNLPSKITARLGSKELGAQQAMFEVRHLLLVFPVRGWVSCAPAPEKKRSPHGV